jgi:hypothetical protein
MAYACLCNSNFANAINNVCLALSRTVKNSNIKKGMGTATGINYHVDGGRVGWAIKGARLDINLERYKTKSTGLDSNDHPTRNGLVFSFVELYKMNLFRFTSLIVLFLFTHPALASDCGQPPSVDAAAKLTGTITLGRLTPKFGELSQGPGPVNTY